MPVAGMLVIGPVAEIGTGVVNMPPKSIGITCVVPEMTVVTVDIKGSISRGLTEVLELKLPEVGVLELFEEIVEIGILRVPDGLAPINDEEIVGVERLKDGVDEPPD